MKGHTKVKLLEVNIPDIEIAQYARISHGVIEQKSEENNKRLLKSLFKRGHLEPFEFQTLIFYIKCSIVAERQILRHRIGVSKVEKSLRYVKANKEVEFYLPELNSIYSKAFSQAYDAYVELIKRGVKPEEARYVLPLGTMTEMYIQFNARSLMNFLKLRLDKKVQPETRQIAEKLLKSLKDHPYTVNLYELFTEAYYVE